MDKKVPRLYEKCNARVIVEVNFSSARVELVPSAPPTPVLLPPSALSPFLLPPPPPPLLLLLLLLLATRSIFFRADTSANRSTVKFSKRVTPRCGNTAWKTWVRDVPREKRNRPISDSPTVCMHLVFELRYTSRPHPVVGNVTKLPMKRTTRRHFSHLETVRLEITVRASIPILTNTTKRRSTV